ncbi:hypothetical protein M404DRAFT_992027 [Pisolithus tinctorius Marx 270]|uniref:Uncharacterized protein n=1 Tax=Pisolithus tinctorius Marx 270 TaxID=870435 RepID=A0A0C3PWQ6_PISTI|nr:hypothetical protein M404DRAFT_992027 [Pisolithus tinctorius Marx 270]
MSDPNLLVSTPSIIDESMTLGAPTSKPADTTAMVFKLRALEVLRSKVISFGTSASRVSSLSSSQVGPRVNTSN